MSDQFRMITPFPQPPGSVLRAWELLQIVRRGDPDEIAEAGVDLNDLPRPWLPADCPDELREAIWEWCDAVAAWVNHEYAWRPQQVIPPCWPRHRYTLPLFLDRLGGRLGESTCRTGKHQDWPAEARWHGYFTEDQVSDRAEAIYADTHAPIPLRPTAQPV